MNIKDIKELCEEHEELSLINNMIDKAYERQSYIKISNGFSEYRITDKIISLIKEQNYERIKEIELMLEDKYINVEKL